MHFKIRAETPGLAADSSPGFLIAQIYLIFENEDNYTFSPSLGYIFPARQARHCTWVVAEEFELESCCTKVVLNSQEIALHAMDAEFPCKEGNAGARQILRGRFGAHSERVKELLEQICDGRKTVLLATKLPAIVF